MSAGIQDAYSYLVGAKGHITVAQSILTAVAPPVQVAEEMQPFLYEAFGYCHATTYVAHALRMHDMVAIKPEEHEIRHGAL